MSVPMLPPAPGRLSTITVWPKLSPSFCPISRAMMSFVPPGENATTILTGLTG
jgi:hypothetical protein